MTLYEIDSTIMDCVDEETGEIFDEERFAKLQLSREEKIEVDLEGRTLFSKLKSIFKK
jgi:hypothetical protein